MLFVEFLVVILIAATFGFLAPRAGLVVGPTMVLLGVSPAVLLALLPWATRVRMEEQYGMMVTLAFLALTSTGIMTTLFCIFSGRR